MSEVSFTTHKFVIPFNKYNEVIYLSPFGDLHSDSPLFDKDRWEDYCNWAKDKGAYLIGMGDYIDFMSGSERKSIVATSLHSTSLGALENHVSKQIEILAENLEKCKDRIIGLIEGNHHYKFSYGITSTQLLCQKLGCKYLGNSAFVRLILKNENSRSNTIDIFAHHGRGSGRRLGTSINSLQDMLMIADADIYLQGHDHKKQVAIMNRLYLPANNFGELDVRSKKIIFGRTGGFLKGYVNGQDSYVADALLTPTDLGTIKIEMTPVRKVINNKNERYIDLHASI